MAGVTKQDILAESSFMADLWVMIKKFWIPEDTDIYWAELTQYADELWKKYERSFFAQKMIVAYCDYLDQKFRRELKKKDEKEKK